ncbi:glutathione-dependent formaldehyde-activating [Botryosphaeria dothidea]|uniref:Glutathione-dependent formaldehyde-activating n=1 Tax=Botryosphaeria dothidea TaxID=55169 RepID=A0A8H4J1X6_9PEZI|nr:glutathione-dependent formaldehyde-activating [Botryosphaeria dothidea]
MLHGTCLCGGIEYEIDISDDAALKTTTCHCRSCRKITSATTSLNLTAPSSAFKLIKGTLKTVTTRHIDEGFDFSIAFCGSCGSAIYALPPGQPPPPVVIIQVGTLDDAAPLEATPEKELNIKYRPGWVGEAKGAVQCRTYIE